MYGVKFNGQDTVENMAITSSTVKSKVQALVRGADVVNVDCKSGLCQVTMELNLMVACGIARLVGDGYMVKSLACAMWHCAACPIAYLCGRLRKLGGPKFLF